MVINLNYQDFKAQIPLRQCPLQYIQLDYGYDLYLIDGDFIISCVVKDDADKTDFETNYKSTANKPLSDFDRSGRNVIRLAMTEKGWGFLSYIAEITTATETNSVKQINFEGQNRFNVEVFHLKSDGTLVTDYTTDQVNIVETRITLKPTYDYEILKGNIFNLSVASNDCHVGVGIGSFNNVNGQYIEPAPGVKLYSEFIGGLNLKLFQGNVQIDGESSKFVAKDKGLGVDLNMIQVRIHHAAGLQHTFMCSLDYYRE